MKRYVYFGCVHIRKIQEIRTCMTEEKIMKRRNIFNLGIDPAIAKLKKEIDMLPLAYHK